MFKNYVKIALRNLFRHKAFSFINIAGLAIGMASSILILLWVQNELSYDKFNANADRIFRLKSSAQDFHTAINCAGMPVAVKAKMPEVETFLRVSHYTGRLFEYGNQKFEERNIIYADSNFLQFFSYPLLKGDRKTAMQRPDGILITDEMAEKYFGHEDPIGKLIKVDNNYSIAVTGVLAKVANSHLQFDFVIPMNSPHNEYKNEIDRGAFDSFNFFTYLQLRDHVGADPASIKKIEEKCLGVYKEHASMQIAFHMQPLTSIHLDTPVQIDTPGHGNRQYVNIFFIVAIFIMVVACINFMNLATARSARRAKEVGLRKVVGAVRGQLIGQFLGEAMLISFISLGLALVLVYFLLPVFNNLSGKSLTVNLLNGKLITLLLIIAVGSGLLSGSYPALFLSGFKPVKVLKGNLRALGGNLVFRNALVVTQFVVSIILLAGTVVIYQQLSFIHERNPGFQKDNLVYMEMTGDYYNHRDALNAALAKNALTGNYTFISELPIDIDAGTIDVTWPGKDPKSQVVIPSFMVSESFTDVFKTNLLNGRGFSKEFKADSNNFIINETMAKVMGLNAQTAVGSPLAFGYLKGMVIGVVQDFNFKPIQTRIEPLVLMRSTFQRHLIVRAAAGETPQTIKALEGISRELNPAYPFNYGFLDQRLEALYKGEQQMGSLFKLFAILAIFISCLGLYGLSAFIAQQRTKEIGVRKVLGASLFSIVSLLSTGFTRLLFIAAVIAVPVAWYGLHKWLQGYAYHITLDWPVFALSVIAAFVIAWLTVSYESIKAGVANPVKSLRTE